MEIRVPSVLARGAAPRTTSHPPELWTRTRTGGIADHHAPRARPYPYRLEGRQSDLAQRFLSSRVDVGKPKGQRDRPRRSRKADGRPTHLITVAIWSLS